MLEASKRIRQRRNSQSQRGFKIIWEDFKTFESFNDPDVSNPFAGKLAFEIPGLAPYDVMEMFGSFRMYQEITEAKLFNYSLKTQDDVEILKAVESVTISFTGSSTMRMYFKCLISPKELSANSFVKVTNQKASHVGTMFVGRGGPTLATTNNSSLAAYNIGKNDLISYYETLQFITRFYFELYYTVGGNPSGTCTSYELENTHVRIYRPLNMA